MGEVNSSQAIQKSKRRWPHRVVGVSLALALTAVLWPQANHDQRFVGTWHKGWITYQFEPDGSGSVTYLPPPAEQGRFPNVAAPVRWWNDGRILCVDLLGGGTVSSLYGRLKRFYLRQFHPEQQPFLLERWHVEGVNEHQLSYYQLHRWKDQLGRTEKLELLQRVAE